MTGVLGALESQEEVAESESGDDREGSHTSQMTLFRRIKIKAPNHRIIWSRRLLYWSLRRGARKMCRFTMNSFSTA